MSKSFKLVNPYIIGSMNTTVNADTSLEAAKLAYDNLSQYFGNHMPSFKFTLMRESSSKKSGGSKFYNFQVNEKKDKHDTVKYEIKEVDNLQDISKFKTNLKKLMNQDNKQSGGDYHKKKYVKRSDDEDDYDSDYFDSELERPRKGPLVYEPIVYYYYNPFIYTIPDRIYVPTFVLPIQPRVVFDSHSLLYLGR